MAKGTHRVAGLRGAVVRAGIELDSEVVGELDHGAVLSAVSHCTSRLGVERVRIWLLQANQGVPNFTMHRVRTNFSRREGDWIR